MIHAPLPSDSIRFVQFEAVIGLEIHAQLRTATKIFCGCGTAFGAPPNTQVCPVCLGFPGALPVLNAKAVELAVKAALALGCEIQPTSIFARKNYFYPDLPKGYQISQYERPFALAGRVRWQTDGEAHDVRITRVHMEEDAGKSLHDTPESATGTCLDFNRAGTPLVEIVTEPDIRSGAVAADFFSRLRDVLTTVGANDGNLEEGSLRCDANVSVRPVGTTTLGTKVEIKNLNSFRFVQKAIEYEIVAAERGRARGRPHRAGDAAVGRRCRLHRVDAQQGRGARLSLFPRARSAAAADRRGRPGAAGRRSCRSCPKPCASDWPRSTACPPTTPAC